MTNINKWPNNIVNQTTKVLSNGNSIKARKLLDRINKLPDNLRGKKLRLGIVRTFTIETQLVFFKLAISMLPAKVEIKIADIDNIEQELLNPKSDLLSWKPDIVLVLWRLEEIITKFFISPHNYSNKEYNNIVKTIKLRINNLVSGYTSIVNSPLILSTMPMPQVIDIHDVNNEVSYRKIVEEINLEILKCNNKYKKISVFDFKGWSSLLGKDSFDRKMNFFARQPISSKAIGSFVNEIARNLRPFIYTSSKAIAIDADNILWGGVIGEDGINKLKIGYDFPGNIYRSIQEFILKLKKRGILLFLLSKNNIGDIKKTFSEIKDMPLKFNDFDAVEVNWNNKFINLKKIAKDFNLGLESFVFVDDQSFEREQMKFILPQVNVLNVSEDPLTILSVLEDCWLFDKLSISKEDKIRSIDYTSEVKRKFLKKSLNNTDKFLKTLALKATISPLNVKNIYRASQLLARTNQFNLRTQRHPEAQLEEYINNSQNILLTLSLSDQFGDQGMIGLIIGLLKKDTTLFIDSFLLSCRALGRGAEQALWYVFLKKAFKKNVKNIRAEYICTQKNSQVSDIFDNFGMIRIKESKINTLYELNLPYKFKKPDWIKIIINNR